MSRMNYNRPQFRVQGRSIIDVREERERLNHQATEWLKSAPSKWPEKKKSPGRIKGERKVARQAKRTAQAKPLSAFDLVAAVEHDVRQIATSEFFNTQESIHAEVRHRLAWHVATGRLSPC